MWGFFKKNDDQVGLHGRLGRLLNVYAKADIEAEQQRSESRMRLALPCILFLASELKEPRSYVVGVTVDISLHGVGVITNELLEQGEYVLAFGPPQLRTYVLASCKRALKSDFGTYTLAFVLQRVLTPKEQQAIVQAIMALENAPSQASPAPDQPNAAQSMTTYYPNTGQAAVVVPPVACSSGAESYANIR